MGYYTWYNFSTKNNKNRISDIIEYMKGQLNRNDWFYPFSYSLSRFMFGEDCDDFDLEPDDTAKWHDHDSEMLELSRQFPETVFCLYGEGEESGDLWYTYYKNGKMQHCPVKMEFDEYDEAKLI